MELDAQTLQQLTHKQLVEEVQALARGKAKAERELETFKEQIRLMVTQRYGRRSERQTDDPTSDLFNEAEALIEAEDAKASQADPDIDDDADSETITYTRKKSKPGRKPIPDHLPREVIEHDLAEADKICGCGEGKTRIGAETSERLEYIPARLYVEQHVRHQYACRCCEEHGVQIAEMPASILPKSNAGPGLLAYTLVSKFQDSLPLHRQSTILARHEVDIPRHTLARWHIKASEKIEPLIERFEAAMQASPVILIDETRLQVNKEPNKEASSQSYMWVRRGVSPPDHPDDQHRRPDVTLYHYSPSRSGSVAADLLRGYTGAIVTDGYAGYDKVAQSYGLQHGHCWAHARRKFVEAEKALPKGKKSPAITAILNEIKKLYALERRIKDSTPDEKVAARQTEAEPILTKLQQQLEKKQHTVTPKSALGKAIGYTLKYWYGLTQYLINGNLPIDNNGAENAIRPFVVGRKNWLFSDSVKGAQSSARWYSMMETAKANGLEPYRYLKWVFEQLPLAKTEADIDKLLPWKIEPDTIG